VAAAISVLDFELFVGGRFQTKRADRISSRQPFECSELFRLHGTETLRSGYFAAIYEYFLFAVRDGGMREL
jgi:hypothetical protein